MEKKCSCCGATNMILGEVQTADSFKLYFVPDKESKKLLPKSKKISAYVCAECGNVALHINK